MLFRLDVLELGEGGLLARLQGEPAYPGPTKRRGATHQQGGPWPTIAMQQTGWSRFTCASGNGPVAAAGRALPDCCASR